MRTPLLAIVFTALATPATAQELEPPVESLTLRSDSVDSTRDKRFGSGSRTHVIGESDCIHYTGETSSLRCSATSDADATDSDTSSQDATSTEDGGAEDAVTEDTGAEDTGTEDTGTEDTGADNQTDNETDNDTGEDEGSAPGKADAASAGTVTVTAGLSAASQDSREYTKIAVAVGTECTESGAPTTTEGKCVILDGYNLIEYQGSIDVDISFDALLGDCTDDSDTNIYIYAEYLDVNNDAKYDVHKEVFQLDYSGPAAPAGVVVSAGEGNLKVSWTAAEDTSYRVYWAGESFTSDTGSPSDSGSDTLTGTSYQIDAGLVNGTEYHVGVVSVDSAGNESAICSGDLLTSTPINVDDFFEAYHQQGGHEVGGSGCSAGTRGGHTAGWIVLAGLLMCATRRRHRASGATLVST